MVLPALRRVAAVGIAVAAVIAIIAIPALTQAQTGGNGFRVSPVRSELTIEKGKSETIEITVENPSDGPVTAQAIVNDFIASDQEDGEPRLILDDSVEAPKNSFRSLVSPIGSVELGPKEKKEVPVEIRVPEDANAGGYYGAVRFAPSSASLGTGNVGLTASVGTIVLVRVPGDLTERLDLVELATAQGEARKSFFTSGNVDIITRVENAGDIHLKPFGSVIVKDMFGNAVAQYEINNTDPRSNVLPDSIRKFTETLPDNNWLGRYTVVANIGYTQGSGQILTAETTFWYLPVWFMVVAFLLIVGLIIGGYVLYRRRNAKGKKRK